MDLDIFRIVTEKDLHWIESATTLSEAKVRVSELGERLPGTYMILGKPSGERAIIVSKPKNSRQTGN